MFRSSLARPRRFELQLLVQKHQRQQRAAQAIDGRSVHPLDAPLRLLGIEPHEFQQTHLRNGIPLAAADDDQRRNDRQRERNLRADRRPLSRRAFDIDRAADLFDVGADDIHAHAAAGKLRHAVGGRESGQEDQSQQFLRRHAGGDFRRDELGAERLFAHAGHVDARRRRR